MDTEITLFYFMNKSSIWQENVHSETWSAQLTEREAGKMQWKCRVCENDQRYPFLHNLYMYTKYSGILEQFQVLATK